MALTAEQYAFQSAVLNGNVSDNPDLIASGDLLATTEKKSTIKSTNELVNRRTAMGATVNTMLDEIITIVGDWVTTPTLQEDMQDIGGASTDNILETLKYLSEKFTTINHLEKTVFGSSSMVKYLSKILGPAEREPSADGEAKITTELKFKISGYEAIGVLYQTVNDWTAKFEELYQLISTDKPTLIGEFKTVDSIIGDSTDDVKRMSASMIVSRTLGGNQYIGCVVNKTNDIFEGDLTDRTAFMASITGFTKFKFVKAVKDFFPSVLANTAMRNFTGKSVSLYLKTEDGSSVNDPYFDYGNGKYVYTDEGYGQ